MSDIDKALAEMVAMAEGAIAAKSRYVDEAHWGYNNVEEFAYHARPDVIVALAKELARLRSISEAATKFLGALDAEREVNNRTARDISSGADYQRAKRMTDRKHMEAALRSALTPADGGQ